jgi:hypothetical protein
MYTKVFRSIYDGTLADNWQAMVTFQQMLILADSQGVVDMTPSAMARITGIPIDILVAGIAVLEASDAGSRTPDMEGRRIALLDPHRNWGWFLVNFAKYRAMQTREEKNEADRERMRAKRAAERSNVSQGVAGCSNVSQGVAGCSNVSQGVAGCSNVSQAVASVANVAHTDTDTDTDTDKAKECTTCIADSPSVEPSVNVDPANEFEVRRKRTVITCPVQRIADLWDEVLPELASPIVWNDARKTAVSTRWREMAVFHGWKTQDEGVDWFRRTLVAIRGSPFLMGRVQPRDKNQKPFALTLDWMFGPRNFLKVVEGKYHEQR